MNIRRPKICRICRAPDNDDLISVQLIQQSITIAHMVEGLTGIKVTADKNLPQNICLQCLERLRSAYQLRQQCIESDMLLRREIYPNCDGEEIDKTERNGMVKLEIEALDENDEDDLNEDNEPMKDISLIENDAESNDRIDLKIILEDGEVEEPVEELTILDDESKIAAAQELIAILAPEEDKNNEKPGILYLKHYAEEDYEVLLQTDHYELIKLIAAECCGCSERFQDKQDLLEHGILVHQKDRKSSKKMLHECPICFRQFSQADAVVLHRKQNDIDRYHCRECDILLESRLQMLQHLERTHAIVVNDVEGDELSEEENIGGHAPSSSLATYNKNQYRLIATDNGYDLIEFICFRCCGCEDLFETREDFEAHSKQLHLPKRVEQDEQKPYECSICYERFDKKTSLTFHRNKPNKRRLVCRVCERIFKGESYLRKHMVRHHGLSLENNDCNQSVMVENMEIDNEVVDITGDTYNIHEIEYIDNLPEDLLGDFQDPTDDEDMDSGDDDNEDIHAKEVSKYAATRQRKQMAFIPGNFIRVIAEHDGYNIVEITKERCCCCLKFFDSLEELNEHMEQHQTEALAEELPPPIRMIRYECEYCLKKFDIAMIFVIHKRIREQKQFYQCRLCDFVIDSESRLKNHMLYNDQHAKFFNLIREDVSDRYDIVKVPGLRCCGCGSYFEDASALADHSRKDHPRDRMKDSAKRKQACSICDKRFNTVSEVAAHQQKKGSTIRYYCKLCDFQSPSEARILKHLYSSIHNESLPSIEVKQVEVGYRKPGSIRYCCFGECSLPFHDIDKLQEHVEEEHQQEREKNIEMAGAEISKRWQCDCCYRLFRTVSILKQHQFVHRVPKTFVCAVCGESKPNKTALTTHEMKHTGERPFGCNLCDKRFTSRTILNSHMKCHFPKQYQCPECGEKFARGENLKRHIRHRHSEATFCCSYCPRKVKTREAQILHERSHTGEKPFECRTDGCDKRYASITDRRRHEMASHTGERPHKCTFCTASFVRKRQLTIHERKHTGERPFVCNRCGKAFIDAPLLKKHTC